MNISFDAQLLFEREKTGIGWTVEYILKNIIKESSNECYLNYFSLRNNDKKKDIIEEYTKLGYKTNKCAWFHNVIYKKTCNTIQIPYSLFFGNKAQITQFFNYDIPPGVQGKAVTFVYDMVYKAFPETVSKKTMQMLDYNLTKSFERADHIITISEFSKSEIIKYMKFPEAKISVMPCGVDLTIYNNNYSSDSINEVKERYLIKKDYILYLGTIEPRKNIERLVEAYALLKKSISNPPKLVIAGKKGWMYSTIFNKVEERYLQNDVIFTDYVDAKDVPVLIQGAMCFVFPSVYEGFGLPPLEAMACGTPVIVSNKASIPEVVGDAGYYIDPYSIYDIKDAIEKLISNAQLREDLKQKGLYQAKKFTWKSSMEKLIMIYEALLE